MALYMGKVKIAGSGSGGSSYVLSAATDSTLGGIKVGMADTDEKLGVKLDPTTKQAYVTKTGGSGGTCNYNYSQLSGTVEDIVEGNNTAIQSIVSNNNTAIGSMVDQKVVANNPAIGNVVQDKLTANNPTLSTMISSVVDTIVVEKGGSSGMFIDPDGTKYFIGAGNYTLTADSTVFVQVRGISMNICIYLNDNTTTPISVLDVRGVGGSETSPQITCNDRFYLKKGTKITLINNASSPSGDVSWSVSKLI